MTLVLARIIHEPFRKACSVQRKGHQPSSTPRRYLAMSLSVEEAGIVEHFQWLSRSVVGPRHLRDALSLRR